MSENASQDQKTEEPSEKKIEEALKQGNTPFSRETVAFGSLIGILVALTFFVPAATQQANAPQLTWHTDLDEARALAERQHKPLLLLFRCEP